MYFGLDHSGGPKQYPVTITCVRIENPVELKKIVEDLRTYLRKGKFASAERREIKWIDLKIDQRYWLSKRISKSKFKSSAIYINSSLYSKLKTMLATKIGLWQYKLFGVWCSKAIEALLCKKELGDIHIDRFLEDREGKPTKEMFTIISAIEKILQSKDYSVTVGIHESTSDIGIQIADYVAGIVNSRANLKRKYRNFMIPKNIVLKVNPRITKKLKLIIKSARGARRTGMNPTSLNNRYNRSYLKLLVDQNEK